MSPHANKLCILRYSPIIKKTGRTKFTLEVSLCSWLSVPFLFRLDYNFQEEGHLRMLKGNITFFVDGSNFHPAGNVLSTANTSIINCSYMLCTYWIETLFHNNMNTIDVFVFHQRKNDSYSLYCRRFKHLKGIIIYCGENGSWNWWQSENYANSNHLSCTISKYRFISSKWQTLIQFSLTVPKIIFSLFYICINS